MTTDSSDEDPPPTSPENENFSKNNRDLSSEPNQLSTSTGGKSDPTTQFQDWSLKNDQKKIDLDIKDKETSLKHRKDLVTVILYIVIFFYGWFFIFLCLSIIGSVRIDTKLSLAILIFLGSIPTALLISIMRGVFKSNDPTDQKEPDDTPSLPVGPVVTIFTELARNLKQ